MNQQTAGELARVVAGLRSHGDRPVPFAGEEARQLAASSLGDGPAGWVAQTAKATGELVVQRNPQDPAVPVADVVRASELTLAQVLIELTGGPPTPMGIRGPQHEITRDVVDRDVPVGRVVTSVRHIQAFWTDLLLDQAVATRAHPRTLRYITVVVARVFDSAVDAAVSDYVAERERRIDSAAEHRRQLVTALLAGDDIVDTLIHDDLGLDLAAPHLALIVASGGDWRVLHHAMRRVPGALANLLQASIAVRQEVSEGTLWIWLAGGLIGDPAVLRGEQVITVPGVLVGVGTAQPGRGGFRQSHLEALDALRLARRGLGPLVLAADFRLETLLSQDEERGRWFVGAQLGQLGAPEGHMRELRGTLAVYYASGLRPVNAAAQLHLHRNTLLHRLRRIEELLGHPVTEHIAEVMCALRLLETFGE